jgi:hypothetical protein
MPRSPSVLGFGALALLASCAHPAPPAELPRLRAVAAIEVDPGCTPASCPPVRVVREPTEVAFRLALHHALNKDWQSADDASCPDSDRSRRSVYLDARGETIAIVWEHASPDGIQLAYRNPDSGCQVTPRWTRHQVASAMEAAQRLYGPMMRDAGTGDR